MKRYRKRSTWLRARQGFICSTDASALWNCNPWQSAYGVCWSKLSPVENREPSILQRHGHACEQLIAELFTEETGVQVVDPGDFALYSDGVIAATPDRFTKTGDAVVELKTAAWKAADEWQERIPRQYQVQVQHAMMATGLRKAYIAVLLNGSGFRHHTMTLNESFARAHRARCETFWRDCVESGTYPPPDYSDATHAALASQYPEDDGEIVTLPKSLDVGGEWRQHWAAERTAKQNRDEIKHKVQAEMGSATIAVLPSGGEFRWKGKNGKRRFTYHAGEGQQESDS